MQENIKEIVKAEYEAGSGAKELADKYKIKSGTIRAWAKRYKWSKKKQTKKRNATDNAVTLQKDKTLQDNVTNKNVTQEQKKNIIENIIDEESEIIKINNLTVKSKIKYKKLSDI